MATGRRFSLAVSLTIFFFLSLYAALFLYHAMASLIFPYPLEYGEGAVLNVASRLAAGGDIYRDIGEPPYISANYPPLYFAINALAIWLVGPSFLVGRLLSVLATLGASWLIFVVVYRRTEDKYAAVVAALLLLSFGPVYSWGAVYKADLTAVFLGLMGFHLLDRERPRPVLSALVLLMAFFTKQTMITALVAGMLYLGLRSLRGTRPEKMGLLSFLLMAVGVGPAVFFSLDRFTGGQLSLHVIGLNVQEVWWHQAAYALGIYIRTHAVVLALALATALGSLRRRVDGWTTYFFVALLGLLASVGKAGAYTNYFVESLAIACVLFGLGLARWRRRRFGAVLLPIVVLQLAFLANLPYYAEPTPTPRPSDFEVAKRLVERISAAQGPVLAENAGWLAATGRQAVVDDLFFFAELARTGRWKQEDLVNMLSSQQFSLVVLEFDPRRRASAEYHLQRFTPEMLDALDRGYKVEGQIGDFFLMAPLGSSTSGRDGSQ